MAITETAYAKINLALHVRRRRDDGYHELETVFAFVDDGDLLTARPAAADTLHVTGEFAPAIGAPFGNLVSTALGVLPRSGSLAVTLDKRLPVAAGLGGGSADAGAVFRIVREASGLPDDWSARAARLGADVPACVESRTCIGRGTGTALEPADDALAGIAVLLVNPRTPLSTGAVFAAWDGIDRGPLPDGDTRLMTREGRNDLQKAAIMLCPAIAEVLEALRATEPMIARMSGSGATCFALYEDDAARDCAAAMIERSAPDWWQMRGFLR